MKRTTNKNIGIYPDSPENIRRYQEIEAELIKDFNPFFGNPSSIRQIKKKLLRNQNEITKEILGDNSQ